jgi:hypothetical protein
MKKLLLLLFSIFFLSSPSVFADDISDFEIEGISIGDSLLDYVTKDEILKEIELSKDMYFYLNPPDKYSEVYLFKNLQKYDAISFFVRNTASSEYISNKNNKYKILYVRGMLPYIENFDGCIKERDKISEELSKMFPNIDKESSFSVSPSDPSGNSFNDGIWFYFDSGDSISVHCSDWEETFRIKNNWKEGLNISIRSKEVDDWLSDY